MKDNILNLNETIITDYDTQINNSINLLQQFEEAALFRNPRGYIVGYSGGKDSDALINVFERSKVKFSVIHNHTTIDAPETVYYIRRKFKEFEARGIPCKIYYPKMSFWQLCRKKLFLPTRLIRFCCSELKEKDIPELQFATHSFGVRKAESAKRKKNRDSIETRRKKYSEVKKFHFDNTQEVKQTSMCYTNNYFIVNPLAYWSTDMTWQYIKSENIEVNPLYDEGFTRIGCIGCPMAGKKRIMEFERYPKYREQYLKLCNYIIENSDKDKMRKKNFKNGEEYFYWWLETPQPKTIFLGGNTDVQQATHSF